MDREKETERYVGREREREGGREREVEWWKDRRPVERMKERRLGKREKSENNTDS